MLVRLVVLQMRTLVTQVLCGNVVQATGDFHKYLEVQKEVNIVITKCGISLVELHYMVMQEDRETGVRVTSRTPDRASTV